MDYVLCFVLLLIVDIRLISYDSYLMMTTWKLKRRFFQATMIGRLLIHDLHTVTFVHMGRQSWGAELEVETITVVTVIQLHELHDSMYIHSWSVRHPRATCLRPQSYQTDARHHHTGQGKTETTWRALPLSLSLIPQIPGTRGLFSRDFHGIMQGYSTQLLAHTGFGGENNKQKRNQGRKRE